RIRCLCLRHSSDVEAHAGLVEHDCMPRTIEMQLAIAAARASFFERCGIGDLPELASLAPKADYGAQRYIKRSIRFFGELLRRGQHTEQIFANTHWAAHGGYRDLVQLAVGFVVRQRRIQLGDTSESRVESRTGLLLIGCVQLDAEE